MFFRFVPRGDPAEARTQDPQIKSLQAGSPQQE